jgi:ATP:cob(I)alamin adenosyltransferase
MNKYLAYCFLYDDAADLKCDFEILSDEISSMIGLLRSLVEDAPLRDDLSKINELMYHIDPALRTKIAVSQEELDWLYQKTTDLQEAVKESVSRLGQSGGKIPKFVLPQGCTAAAYSHVIRNKCKALVRLLSRYKQQGNKVEDILFDFTNLYSGYFFSLALKLNRDQGVEEVEFKSRVY